MRLNLEDTQLVLASLQHSYDVGKDLRQKDHIKYVAEKFRLSLESMNKERQKIINKQEA
jgi:hypothetical protein